MKKKKKSFCPLVFDQKRALGCSGDIGVVYIIGASHPELLPKFLFVKNRQFLTD